MLVINIGMLDIEEPITVTDSDAVEAVEVAIKRHASDLTTIAMALIALLKLSSRFPSCSERIKDIILQNKQTFVLELQQRSIEFNCILQKHQNIRAALVERMPVLDEATFSGRRAGSLPTSVSTSTGTGRNLPNGIAKPAAAPVADLLDLSSDDAPAPSSSGVDFLQDLLGVDLSPASATPSTSQPPKGGTDVLLDLLSIGASSPPAQTSSSASDVLSSIQDNTAPLPNLNGLTSLSPLSANATSPASPAPVMDLLNGFGSSPQKKAENGPAYPSLVAYESSSLRMSFNFSKQPRNTQTTLIQATFTNLSPNVYNDFLFQAAVPKFLQLHLDSASSNILPANGSISQSMKVTNSQHGKKSLVMRIRIAYKINDKDVLEEGQVNNFPRDL